MSETPDGPTVERFRADLLRLLPEAGTAPIGLAVSGGPDSMAMLVLAHAAFPGTLAVATVDHALRADSAREAVMVAGECAKIGIPHTILLPEDPIAGASLQARAREARYDLLEHWAVGAGVAALLTAHHADDQAETFLMRAARGSGLPGRAAIRARQALGGIALVRPLLDWRRAELRAIVRRAGVPFVDDPANADDRYDRTRFRRLLEANEWLDPPRIARAAGHLAEADDGMRQMHDWLWQARAQIAPQGEVRIDVSEFPRELRRRVAREAIEIVRRANRITLPPFSDSRNIEPMLDALAEGRRATVGGVIASVDGSAWRFRRAPPRRNH
ncbi:hypothetical protein BH09PSE4_BH09PSE4_00780 [soil metagenome]